jgi:nuclear pore complex protein Nup188
LNPENVERGGVLDHYLSDETVINILAQQAPFDLYSKPSQQSKTSFETKTAAINITPTKQGQYDINEIKEDALWLSKEATIDEIAALRIVIQEWQNRPAVQLLSEFSEEEVASIQDASGVQNLRSSVGGAKVSSLFAAVGTHESQASEFLLPQGRRSRFFGIYLSERRYALKASQILISAGIRSELSDLEHENDAARSAKWKGKKSWLQEMAQPVHRAQMHLAKPTTTDNLLPHLISSFESRILGLESGSRWFKDQDGKEDLEDAWSTNMIEEAIHILQIMFAHLYSTDEITSPRSTILWFHCMDRHGFFEGFNPVSSSSEL